MASKRLIILVTVIFIFASLFIGYFLNKSETISSEIQGLKNQINSLQQQKNQLPEKMNELQTWSGENIQQIVLNGSFTISCPIGIVCDENFTYRAYSYHKENVGGLYFSFNPAIVNNYTLPAFRDNFNYAGITLNFPEKSSGSTMAYYQSTNGFKEIRFISYENSVLSGELDFVVDKITYQTPGDCVSEEDIFGFCYNTESVNYRYTLEFHMTMPY